MPRNEPFRLTQPEGSNACAAFTSAQVANVFGMGEFADPYRLMQENALWSSDHMGRYFRPEYFNRWFMDRGGRVENYGPLAYGQDFSPRAWTKVARTIGAGDHATFHNPDRWREIEEAARLLTASPNFSEIKAIPAADDVLDRLAVGGLVEYMTLRGRYVHAGLFLRSIDNHGNPGRDNVYIYDPADGVHLFGSEAISSLANLQMGVTTYLPPTGR
jgi:hypothetical protein